MYPLSSITHTHTQSTDKLHPATRKPPSAGTPVKYTLFNVTKSTCDRYSWGIFCHPKTSLPARTVNISEHFGSPRTSATTRESVLWRPWATENTLSCVFRSEVPYSSSFVQYELPRRRINALVIADAQAYCREPTPDDNHQDSRRPCYIHSCHAKHKPKNRTRKSKSNMQPTSRNSQTANRLISICRNVDGTSPPNGNRIRLW